MTRYLVVRTRYLVGSSIPPAGCWTHGTRYLVEGHQISGLRQISGSTCQISATTATRYLSLQPPDIWMGP